MAHLRIVDVAVSDAMSSIFIYGCFSKATIECYRKEKKMKKKKTHSIITIIALSTSSLDTLAATALAVPTQSRALLCPSCGVGCSSSFQ